MNQGQNTTNTEQFNYEPEKNGKGKNKIIIIAFVLLAVISIGVGYYIGTNTNNDKVNPNSEKQNEDSKNNENENKSDKTVYKIKEMNNGVKYTPSKSFYKENEEEVEYFNIATLTTGETVVSAGFTMFGEMSFRDVFLIDKDNNVKLLLKYSLESAEEYLASGITIDKEGTIPELFPESDITYKGQTLEFQYHGSTGSEHSPDESKAKKVATVEYGDLYEYKYSLETDIYVRRFFVKTLEKKFTHYYELKNIDIQNDDRTLKVNWDDKSNQVLSFDMPLSGCGNAGTRIHINFNPSNGTKIGTVTSNGKPLYQLNDNKILKVFHEAYYSPDVWPGQENPHNIVFEEYKTKLTNVVYQDDLGEWVVLTNNEYGRNGECGKPVIYLYPEKDTYVNVEVGADVTISDPLYIVGGWKNVLARPNGLLTYQGKQYDSLFWEGRGLGLYPNVSGVGKVVTQDKLLSTIKQDLKDQGLNSKEIEDFVEFWKDNLPKSPYVKLYWFTTEQMNTLAPLNIRPKPDTVIRVFLDAKGLKEPIKLTPQKLTKIERKGFTLVEWGGLLVK